MLFYLIRSQILTTLPGPDNFDEAKCYDRLFEFFQVTFYHSRQWDCNLLSILPPRQNTNPVATVRLQAIDDQNLAVT